MRPNAGQVVAYESVEDPARLFTLVRRRGQRVEKVVFCPVGDPRDPENETETLQIRRIQSLNRGQESTRRSFSTRWGILRRGTLRSSLTSRAEATPHHCHGRIGLVRSPSTQPLTPGGCPLPQI